MHVSLNSVLYVLVNDNDAERESSFENQSVYSEPWVKIQQHLASVELLWSAQDSPVSTLTETQPTLSETQQT